MSTEDELRRALQAMAVAEPVDLSALGARVRTRSGARKRRRTLTGVAAAVAICAGVAGAAVAVDRPGGGTSAAAACPAPLPPDFRRIDTTFNGMTGVVPPGWRQDLVPTPSDRPQGSIQVSDPATAGNFVIYRYDAIPGVATLKDFEDAAAGDADFRLLRSGPIPYGTAQQAWDSDYLFSLGESRAHRRDWWIDGRIYSVFFIARAADWARLAAVRQVVLDASRPC